MKYSAEMEKALRTVLSMQMWIKCSYEEFCENPIILKKWDNLLGDPFGQYYFDHQKEPFVSAWKYVMEHKDEIPQVGAIG
jgi:hypothetical protein